MEFDFQFYYFLQENNGILSKETLIFIWKKFPVGDKKRVAKNTSTCLEI